ncbi:hypothetical protein [Chitinophaga solisilvae]|uniref:hypothetical protein n=1 Tax=Chitinophaga solisilvae TaxID=1233460 RepID=UPI00136980B8|nr:hypothetical protein [Chitinophaga solisilvae]
MSNKRVDFSNLGGFPLTQDVLGYMQASYRDAISGLAGVCGDKVIVSGMVESNGTVSAGWIIHNGELLPFLPGPKQSTYIIIDENSDELFEDGTAHTVYYTRYARFGSGGAPYSELIRLDSIAAMKQGISTLNTTLTNLNATLLQHTGNIANPHAVTKQQVGLGNLPNAISNDPALNDPNVLATTRATSNMLKVVRTGNFKIGDVGVDNYYYISLNPVINGDYMVVGSLISHGWNYNDDNDVIWSVKDLAPYVFTLLLRSVSTDVQSISFDYAIILK